MEPLKVAISSQILPGTAGGVATFILSLIHALGRLSDGQETYTIIVGSQQQLDWLKPYAGPNQQFILKPSSWKDENNTLDGNGRVSLPVLAKRLLGPFLPAARRLQQFINVTRYWPEVPLSDGFYESLGCAVLHIPTQNFVLCAVPTIYNPHDVQHLHYPQFWPPSVIAWRETIYPTGCRLAHTVVSGSQWAKDDIVRQYQISPEKVQIIPEGPPSQFYAESSEDFLTQVKSNYRLEQPFALYPAVTWQHKNHLRLLDAVAFLRQSCNLKIQLVCTGSRHASFWGRIERRIEELQLQSQVKFLGFIPENDLRALYRLADFLIEPSLFEASSLPIFEAWSEGLPVACSNTTALPEQVGDAALLFDPVNVESIANALKQMVMDVDLKQRLRKSGHLRLKDFDWGRTAKTYRAVYRRAASYPLTEEDRWLLSWDWMNEPRKKMENRL